jgi:hypothetical protein
MFTTFLRIGAAGLLAIALLPSPARASDAEICAAAAADAERDAQLPAGLLLAIGRVESRRRDPATGRIAPWPWTIDAAGAGQSFADAAAALARTRELLGKGVASIDVGCFQVNLAAHPQAFASLEQAFDPAANASYAARFLTTLHARIGSWDGAIAAYHSATAELGAPYRDLVLAAWGQPATEPSAMPVPAAPPILRVIAWSPTRSGVRIWTPSAGAGASVISFAGAPALPAVRTPRG